MDDGLIYALRHLVEGKSGPEQPTRVRGNSRLATLEELGHIEWRDGWRLTTSGIELRGEA